MHLTLVPKPLAQVGYRFHFAGPNQGEECEGCPFQKMCFGLEPGRTYEVTKLRSVTHPCALHEEGKVQVAEVEPASFQTSLEKRLLRGTAATWKPIPCERPDCHNYKLCHPVGPTQNVSYELVATGDALDCPADYELQQVELKMRQK